MAAKVYRLGYKVDTIKVDLYRGETLTGHCDNYTTGSVIDLKTLECDRVVADRVKLTVPNGYSASQGLEIWDIKVRGEEYIDEGDNDGEDDGEDEGEDEGDCADKSCADLANYCHLALVKEFCP